MELTEEEATAASMNLNHTLRAAQVRLSWAVKLVDCYRAGIHHYPDENAICPECETGECQDCLTPIFWHEPTGWYRHIYPDKTCFLIQNNDLTEAT